MYKYLVFWTLMKLMPSSDKPLPKYDDFMNALSIVVTCDTLKYSINYAYYYREFHTRDSAINFLHKGDTTKNVSGLKLDSVLIPKDTTTSK